MRVRKYSNRDLPDMIAIWNDVVDEGNSFPQEEPLDKKTGTEFFGSQSCSSVAVDFGGNIHGLYILHPNNVGRCSHICNASFAVAPESRGQGVGKDLVNDCIRQAKALGFSILQFNAVVETNEPAKSMYEHMGFVPLGTIPGGFRLKDGSFANICLYYLELK
ncbi:MAG: GNAT family N-acetyltransferase [Lachnospiraceae bacterium]|nr:GNAT family N-acetyltransferase [Lachnospiraceae bacterium]